MNYTIPVTSFGSNVLHQPLIFGMHGQLFMRVEDVNLAAGAIDKDYPPVPAGQIWVINHLSFQYTGTAPGILFWTVVIAGNEYMLWGMKPPVTGVIYDRQGQWILTQGHKLRLKIQNATLNNDILSYALGYFIDMTV
jgi:hypothetical protein